MHSTIAVSVAVLLVAAELVGATTEQPLIFPLPQELEATSELFRLDDNTVILLSPAATEHDRFLARFLVAELSDRFGYAAKVETAVTPPEDRNVIVISTVFNQLVRSLCPAPFCQVDSAEGYVLRVARHNVVVAGTDDRGAFYGLQSLRQLLRWGANGVEVPGVVVRDWPYKRFRGVKLFLPGRDNLPFFRRFVRDFLGLYKYNTLVIEMNAAMRLDRHPELNAGWIELAKSLNYTRRDRPWGPGYQFQNSVHHDTGDGAVLDKEEVAEIVRFARRHHLDVIPEIPSLTHSYYLLTRHRDLAEIPDAEWPDTYCPSNPRSYDLLFDVLDEYAEATQPQLMHVGHDEWRVPVGICFRCRSRDPRELYAEDLRRIYEYLRTKGINVAIWGDHLIEGLRGERVQKVTSRSGFRYYTPGGLSAEQVQNWIPKDVLVFNWFWRDGQPGQGESTDLLLEQLGFRQVYGNLKPDFPNWGRRSARASVLGGAPSSWAATTEFNIGKDQLFDFLGCANLLWSRHWPESSHLIEMVQAMMPSVRRNLSGVNLPSEDGDRVVNVDFGADPGSLKALAAAGLPQEALDAARITTSAGVWQIPPRVAVVVGDHPSLPRQSVPIQIGEDVSSLIFLHACAKPAGNAKVDVYVYNPADTADLLGWYEVVYEDGLVDTIPLRYGVNILDWHWRSRPLPARYVYRARAVPCGATSQPLTFFAFEWVNPRFGKVIKKLRLKAASGFRNTKGEVVSGNAVVLRALGKIGKRTVREPPRQPKRVP